MSMTFANDLVKYALGRRGNMENWNTITRTYETADTLGFGVPVQRGAGEHGCIKFTTGDFLGVTEASQVNPHTGDNFVQYENVPVCEEGVIGVLIGSTGCTAGAPAVWNSTTGKWVTTTPTTNIYAVPGAEFETTGAADTVQLVRLRRPVPAS